MKAMTKKKANGANGAAPEVAEAQQRLPQWFLPGQSGNPAGRPKGSRNKLSEAFVSAMMEDFTKALAEGGKTQGMQAIEKVRDEDPVQYLKVIASILPKHVNFRDETLSDVDDTEIDDLIALAAAARRLREAAEGGEERAGSAKPN